MQVLSGTKGDLALENRLTDQECVELENRIVASLAEILSSSCDADRVQQLEQEVLVNDEQLDDEFLRLQKQLQALTQEVATLRETIPALILDATTDQLRSQRPPDTSVTSGDVPMSETTEEAMMAQENADVMSQAVAGTINKLPGVRARIQQAVQRLERTLSALQAEQERPSPKTVERVVMNKELRKEEEEGTPALGPSVSGGDLTRRRLASSLTQQ